MSARPLLLCRHCSKVSVKYQDCKATCNSCEVLRASVQSDTGLQIRIVQELSACQDLHPACAEWQKAGKCSREPKTMLELCQVSEGVTAAGRGGSHRHARVQQQESQQQTSA